jgi:electron transport complex protein RnfB
LAYIHYEKCKLCRKCVPVCPTNAIHELNFPPRKAKPAAPKAEKETTAPKADAAENKPKQDNNSTN